MAGQRQIEADVQAILSRSTVEGSALKLPPEQLDRATYEKVNKVLTGLGGKWDRKTRAHLFPFDPASLVTGAVENGRYTDRKQDLQFFETPAELAIRMVQLAGIEPGKSVLEPSAGLGAIARYASAAGGLVTAVEIDKTHADQLATKGWALTIDQADFLEWSVCPENNYGFDAVVMNPPFTKGQDAEHIQRAWHHVAEGGRLVAICGEGSLTRSDKKAVAFQEWLAEIGATIEPLGHGAFRESGTDSATRLIVATRSAT